ncbi:MAG: DUF87 domain-containing protein [Bacteroidales bacterium]|nr:DUF87 domain-containing protein [Bacteroidales bacterium]
MSQSFYKYLSGNIVSFFKNNPIKKGDRYYVIIEDKEKRCRFVEALQQEATAKSLIIPQIYDGVLSIEKDPTYSTFSLTGEDADLIIGITDSADDGYLTTLRNAVGVHGGVLENYGILFILEGNRTESLTTACMDLQSKGLPLDYELITKQIYDGIEADIINEYEQDYLKSYLESIASFIKTGSSSLFDLEDVLAILQDKSLKGSYSKIGLFADDLIYGSLFSVSGKKKESHIQQNFEAFSKVESIMTTETDSSKQEEKLSKFLDDKLAESISRSGDSWKDVPFSQIQASIDKKKSKEPLHVEVIRPRDNAFSASNILKVTKGTEKKSTNHIIVCDTTDSEYSPLQIVFDRNVKELIKGSGYSVSGQYVNVPVSEDVVRFQVAIDSTNTHKFIIQRLKMSEMSLRDIKGCFTINAKGNIIVDAPEDCSSITIGHGSTEAFKAISALEWDEDYYVKIELEEEETVLPIIVGSKKVNFVFRMDSEKVIPLSPSKIFENIWTKRISYRNSEKSDFADQPFYKICSDDGEFSIYERHRDYLRLEKQMIDCKSPNLKLTETAFGQDYEPQDIALPAAVRTALDNIFEYFSKKSTVPSLTYIDQELRGLYEAYLNVVLAKINNIPTDRSLYEDEFYLTRLGVVEANSKVSFSPFSPIMIAYMLEFGAKFDVSECQERIFKLISPMYLMPYIYYGSAVRRPYCDSDTEEIRTWLFYEGINTKQQVRTYNITTEMVRSKIKEFICNFPYLFQDKECPVIINTVGIKDDVNVVKGIIDFVRDQYEGDEVVQRIEIHEYVDNILNETFYEKLNRLNSDERIISELTHHGIAADTPKMSGQELIRQLFSRVTFYKHTLSTSVDYCHITFYQMDSGNEYITPNTNDLRVELSFGGLISIPSTKSKNNNYTIGLGTNGLCKEGYIYPTVVALNNLYANEQHEGQSQYHTNTCVAKLFTFKSEVLLQSIYDNSNWVTFLNPEVDIDFFYKQKVYIVHYTDQYTINAKYDSITVTKHIEQYYNMLTNSFGKFTTHQTDLSDFNNRMMNYFNCLNGSWLLKIINKTDVQVQEKLSIVSACVALRIMLSRIENVIWIPISLEEILRVTGSINLPMDFLFTKKDLKISGSMSDDLLMIGLDTSSDSAPELIYYPVEVKASEKNKFVAKGDSQVVKTFNALRENLTGERTFIKDVYKTFFASQFLSNADKLMANGLIGQDEYTKIEKHRYELLNLKYSIREGGLKELGHAALVSYHSDDHHALSINSVDNVDVCHLNMSFSECLSCIMGTSNSLNDFLASGSVEVVSSSTLGDEEHVNSTPQPSAAVVDQEPSIFAQTDPNVDETSEKAVDQKTEIQEMVPETMSEDEKPQSIKILVGHSKTRSKDAIFFEPNNTRKVSHPNMGIIGTMGTGKTQFARSIIAQFSKETVHNVGGKPIGVLVFDYKGDYKDTEFLDAVGGTCYKYDYPFNPLKLVVTDGIGGMNLPAITADRISDSFAKAYGLGLKQQSNIKQIIIEAYQDKGITKSSDTWNNLPPTMSDVIAKYFETYDANDKAYALFSKLQDYTIFTEDNKNCVSLFEWLDGVKVIDLTMYPDDTKKVIVSLILDLFYNEMRQLGGSQQQDGYRELRAMVMVDEAHQFLKKDFNSFRSIISEGRMFGVGMILSTQNISDFKSAQEDYSQFILSWVIHHVNSISKQELSSIFGATDPHANDYSDFINGAKLFESICKLGSRVDGIRDLPFFELIQKDPRFNTQG